jgi:hypothetical protein
VRRAATARVQAAEGAGPRILVERYRYHWVPDCGMPERSERLLFEAEPDDARFFDVFCRINVGSLDARVRATITENGLDASAHQELDYLRWLPSPRDWWLLAYNNEGDLASIHRLTLGRTSVSPVKAQAATGRHRRSGRHSWCHSGRDKTRLLFGSDVSAWVVVCGCADPLVRRQLGARSRSRMASSALVKLLAQGHRVGMRSMSVSYRSTWKRACRGTNAPKYFPVWFPWLLYSGHTPSKRERARSQSSGRCSAVTTSIDDSRSGGIASIGHHLALGAKSCRAIGLWSRPVERRILSVGARTGSTLIEIWGA